MRPYSLTLLVRRSRTASVTISAKHVNELVLLLTRRNEATKSAFIG